MVGQGKQTSAERRKERAAAARAAAAATARRRRRRFLGGFVALVLLGGAMAGAALGARELLGDDDEIVAADSPEPTASATPTSTPKPAPAGKANCEYTEIPGGSAGKELGTPPELADAKGPFYAEMVVNGGTVVIEFDAENAPCAVNSFVHLAKGKFYDDTPCHRELNAPGNYVLQCGDPTGSGNGGPGYRFAEENLEGATYEKGVIALAKSRAASTSGSQFFMIFDDSDFPPEYTPFGRIISGLQVLTKIGAKGVTGPSNDEPKIDVTIEKVTISTTKPKA